MNAETPVAARAMSEATTPITFVTPDGAHVVVPYNEGLAGIVPGAMPFDWQGQRMLVMPNGTNEAKLARNLGVAVPSPILTRYNWCGTKPWDIQKITAALLAESPRCYVLSSMGTGKTRSVLYAVDYLIRTGLAKRLLVVAPLSTLTPVWETEAFNLMFRHKVRVLYGSRQKRIDLLNEGTPVCIINHHGLRVINQEVIKAGFDIVVFDELAVYRNRTTELWKSAANVVNSDSVKYAWGLTGSPTPNAPTDAWAQVRLLTPARVPRSLVAFRDSTMRQITQFKWHPRPEANAIVHRAMSPSVRYTREDVMELPECIIVDRAASLDDDARKAYTMLWDKARMLTEQGDSITAVNEAVLQGKLLQVACGYLYTDKHTVYQLPATGRLKALADTLDETSNKSLVMVPFLHALAGVSAYLKGKGYDVSTVHGGTSRGVRDKLFKDFQSKASPHIIVAHPQCLAHGLTLTAADTIVWYSPTTSLEIYEQANARINRPGQRNRMLIAHLIGTPVERATYARLRSKQRMQNCLLDLFKAQEVAL